MKTEWLYGPHAVGEALAAGRRRVHELLLEDRPGALRRLEALAAAAARRGVPVRRVPAGELAAAAGGGRHQGAAARVDAYPVAGLEEIPAAAAAAAEGPLLALDGILDPHNFGAILRSALCAGTTAVVVPRDRSAPPTPAVSRASAGALEHVRLVRVTNLGRALDELKRRGYWVAGLDRAAPQSLFAADLPQPLVLVVGGEGGGMRRGILRRCDLLLAIPQAGPLDSLNVSVAAAVALFEIRRRRLGGGPGSAGGGR